VSSERFRFEIQNPKPKIQNGIAVQVIDCRNDKVVWYFLQIGSAGASLKPYVPALSIQNPKSKIQNRNDLSAGIPACF
jgi:hypothetical protein